MTESLQDEVCIESVTHSCCEGGKGPTPWRDRGRVQTQCCFAPIPADKIPVMIDGDRAKPTMIYTDMSNPDIEEAIEGIGLKENVKVYPTGAKRSTDADDWRYDLIPPIGLRRLARAFAEGSVKYGDHNWMKGFPTWDVINHLQKHIEQFKIGDKSEDHLAHAAFGLFVLMHDEEAHPERIELPFKKGCLQIAEGAK